MKQLKPICGQCSADFRHSDNEVVFIRLSMYVKCKNCHSMNRVRVTKDGSLEFIEDDV